MKNIGIWRAASVLLLLSVPILLGAEAKTLKVLQFGPVAVGKQAPALASWDLEDRVVTLAGLLKEEKTRAVLLEFYATWCRECPSGLQVLESGKDKLVQGGIHVLLVDHGEDKETVSAFHRQMRLTLPVVLDEFKEISGAYGIRGLPRAFLIGKDGTVRAIYVSEGADFAEQLLKDADAR